MTSLIQFRDFSFQYDSQQEPTLHNINLTMSAANTSPRSLSIRMAACVPSPWKTGHAFRHRSAIFQPNTSPSIPMEVSAGFFHSMANQCLLVGKRRICPQRAFFFHPAHRSIPLQNHQPAFLCQRCSAQHHHRTRRTYPAADTRWPTSSTYRFFSL